MQASATETGRPNAATTGCVTRVHTSHYLTSASPRNDSSVPMSRTIPSPIRSGEVLEDVLIELSDASTTDHLQHESRPFHVLFVALYRWRAVAGGVSHARAAVCHRPPEASGRLFRLATSGRSLQVPQQL